MLQLEKKTRRFSLVRVRGRLPDSLQWSPDGAAKARLVRVLLLQGGGRGEEGGGRRSAAHTRVIITHEPGD